MVSLFHKELEAHITAEGIFGDEPVEDGNLTSYLNPLSVELDYDRFKFVFVSRSNHCYWELSRNWLVLYTLTCPNTGVPWCISSFFKTVFQSIICKHRLIAYINCSNEYW